MIKAKKNGFTYEEYSEMAHIINDYVLPSSIDEKELKTAIRKEEWDNIEVPENNQLLYLKVQDVIDYWNCIWVNNKLTFFNRDKDRYDTNEDILLCYLLEKYKYENLTTPRAKEVIEQVYIQLKTKPNYLYERNSEYILCGNHLVSTIKDEVIPNTMTKKKTKMY